ncbi:MAG: T9SS type A sorting domain-containing protein [Duncaniella sp.]|uniref:T9SS type A sorting domain-containing protein n=1 Tax=Duncaniella sp. TaxID=2518496 RepID=UPI0023C42C57|nr:T9SS type A sorting domain-containing protein [Duncaniella sp.]MDE5988316.1 T9SS type A sorting domain-containing protein [Duncaniella sp.]MDE6174792.1 T9SS type A sorting domain-containing protein [Duncaniella sp.]
MIKFKALIVAAVVVFGSCLSTSAKTTQLTINMKDGRSIVLDLTAGGGTENEKLLPVMTFTPTSVQVVLPPKESSEPGGTPTPVTYTFEIEDLQTMEPIKTDSELSSITDILASGSTVLIAPIGGDLVRVAGNENLKAGDVKVYDINGRRQSVDLTPEGPGAFIVSLANLHQGVYIVNISSHSLKIIKR